MEINNLSKEDLVKLRKDIDDRLTSMDVKNIKPKKNTLLSLNSGDKIFGVRLSFGPHQLAEPDVLYGEVDIIEYCDISGAGFNHSRDKFTFSISHPTKPFGTSTSLHVENYIDEHCYLSIDTFKTGYDGFYTLRPKTWKYDLRRLLNKDIEQRKKYLQQELEILERKFSLFIESEDKINERI
jgi:hypothetical protein